ncbi:hypothetical protein B0T24DRAFT_598205 [Lasiosphaeria ovina]|uniref:Uncharacterized protein n=1 Tax=Lasiosphaeria ovina TaxID=92902 RepID=A0AAE0JVQ4_9PEZI|nr:hypothetical protein B0T24DRAFT_598205 [Lasiosphaeria ovina]
MSSTILPVYGRHTPQLTAGGDEKEKGHAVVISSSLTHDGLHRLSIISASGSPPLRGRPVGLADRAGVVLYHHGRVQPDHRWLKLTTIGGAEQAMHEQQSLAAGLEGQIKLLDRAAGTLGGAYAGLTGDRGKQQENQERHDVGIRPIWLIWKGHEPGTMNCCRAGGQGEGPTLVVKKGFSDGSNQSFDNNGNSYPLSDAVILQKPQSCLLQSSGALTVTALESPGSAKSTAFWAAGPLILELGFAVFYISPRKTMARLLVKYERFTQIMRSALRLTETPYVWVHQHDWALVPPPPPRRVDRRARRPGPAARRRRHTRSASTASSTARQPLDASNRKPCRLKTKRKPRLLR